MECQVNKSLMQVAVVDVMNEAVNKMGFEEAERKLNSFFGRSWLLQPLLT